MPGDSPPKRRRSRGPGMGKPCWWGDESRSSRPCVGTERCADYMASFPPHKLGPITPVLPRWGRGLFRWGEYFIGKSRSWSRTKPSTPLETSRTGCFCDRTSASAGRRCSQSCWRMQHRRRWPCWRPWTWRPSLRPCVPSWLGGGTRHRRSPQRRARSWWQWWESWL